MAAWGRYPRTFAALLAAVPPMLVERLTAAELASVIDTMQGRFQAGGVATSHRIATGEEPAMTPTGEPVWMD